MEKNMTEEFTLTPIPRFYHNGREVVYLDDAIRIKDELRLLKECYSDSETSLDTCRKENQVLKRRVEKLESAISKAKARVRKIQNLMKKRRL